MDDPKGQKEGQEHDFICCQTADRPGRSSGGGRGIKGGKLGVMQLLIIEEKTVQWRSLRFCSVQFCDYYGSVSARPFKKSTQFYAILISLVDLWDLLNKILLLNKLLDFNCRQELVKNCTFVGSPCFHWKIPMSQIFTVRNTKTIFFHKEYLKKNNNNWNPYFTYFCLQEC